MKIKISGSTNADCTSICSNNAKPNVSGSLFYLDFVVFYSMKR